MESWSQRIVLGLLLACFACSAYAAEDEDDSARVLKDIISPDIERRRIEEDKIDQEFIEVGFYAGVISVEDFGSNDVLGARLAMHVMEFVFIEANAGASELNETSYETLSGETRLLSDEERKLNYYNLSIGLNVLPGEVYIGPWAFHNHFYLVGGAGNTLFADNEYFTYHFGGGFRLYATDWVALRMDVRNHIMAHDLFGEEKQIQNLETHLGLTLFF